MVGEEHTIVGPHVQAPFESPEGVHLLDRRVIRWSQVVHGERAQCELHDDGHVVPILKNRQDVPPVRFGGRDDAHLQDVDFQNVDLRPNEGARQLPASREETFQVSFEVGMRTSGPMCGSTRRSRREHQRRDPVADVYPFRACCSWLRFFRGGAQTTRTGSNCFLWMGQPDSRGRTLCATRLMNLRSIFDEKEAVEAGAHGRREGASTSSCPGAAHLVPRTARDIPNPSCARVQRRQVSVKAHRTTGAQTTEPEHHNGEFVNDAPVSPFDEGVGVVELSRAARRPRTASGSPPRSRRTTRSRCRDSRKCGHRAPCGCRADLLLRGWVHFVSEEVYQEVSPCEPGENDSARVPKFECQEMTICRTPSSPPATYQNCSSKSGAC